VQPILISLGNVQVTGNQATIDVTGVGFGSDDSVFLTVNGMILPLPTVYLSSTHLRATLTSPILEIGHGLMSVSDPGGAGSLFLPFSLPLAIASLSPGGAFAGGPTFDLIISGGVFPQGSLVLWNGAPLSAAAVSLTQMTAEIPSSLISSPGVVDIQVLQPGGAVVSMPFAVNSGLTILSVNPASVAAGGPAATIILTGAGFLRGATVRWNGRSLATTFVDSGELTAMVPASLIASAGKVEIVVADPDGELSNAIPFGIVAPSAAAEITRLNPSAAIANGTSLVLTVDGQGFLPESSVNFNGSPLATTFVSATRLEATVPSASIAAPGPANITVRSDLSVSGAAVFTVLDGPPVTSSAAVVNLGNYTSPIAPGSLISIYGSNLATSAAGAIGTPLPTQLGGVSVFVNGIPAPLLYAGPSQINAQVPYEAPVGLATLVVNVGGVLSAPIIFQLQSFGPGVWSYPESSEILAVNDRDGSLVTSTNPVSLGSYVTVYLTGQGAVMNPVPTGGTAAADPLSTSLAPVVATVGGVPATSASALAPGVVGILQVNILVPSVPSGNQPLTISVGGVPGNVTSLAIAP
jgi:trimeric autotransporter adhesin